MKLKVINLENKDVGEIDLDDGVFAAPIRQGSAGADDQLSVGQTTSGYAQDQDTW